MQTEDVRSRLHELFVRARDLNVLQWVLRQRARLRLDRLEAGAATVVIPFWNAEEMLAVGLAAIQRFADRPTRVLVIDNHSERAPTALASRFHARVVRLPVNLGHSVALDVGFLLTKTEYVMALDVDAFPFDRRWMSTFLAPLDQGFAVSGCEWSGPYAHPCCLAMRTAHFVRQRHSFKAEWSARKWDVGEAISRREGAGRVAIIPKTANLDERGDRCPGMQWFVAAIYGDVLYHNSYGTRHLRFKDPGTGTFGEGGAFPVSRDFVENMWSLALTSLGPATWRDEGC